MRHVSRHHARSGGGWSGLYPRTRWSRRALRSCERSVRNAQLTRRCGSACRRTLPRITGPGPSRSGTHGDSVERRTPFKPAWKLITSSRAIGVGSGEGGGSRHVLWMIDRTRNSCNEYRGPEADIREGVCNSLRFLRSLLFRIQTESCPAQSRPWTEGNGGNEERARRSEGRPDNHVAAMRQLPRAAAMSECDSPDSAIVLCSKEQIKFDI